MVGLRHRFEGTSMGQPTVSIQSEPCRISLTGHQFDHTTDIYLSSNSPRLYVPVADLISELERPLKVSTVDEVRRIYKRCGGKRRIQTYTAGCPVEVVALEIAIDVVATLMATVINPAINALTTGLWRYDVWTLRVGNVGARFLGKEKGVTLRSQIESDPYGYRDGLTWMSGAERHKYEFNDYVFALNNYYGPNFSVTDESQLGVIQRKIVTVLRTNAIPSGVKASCVRQQQHTLCRYLGGVDRTLVEAEDLPEVVAPAEPSPQVPTSTKGDVGMRSAIQEYMQVKSKYLRLLGQPTPEANSLKSRAKREFKQEIDDYMARYFEGIVEEYATYLAREVTEKREEELANLLAQLEGLHYEATSLGADLGAYSAPQLSAKP